MAGVFKYIDVVGTSGESIEKAIGESISQAAKTVRSIGWFEVKEVRGRVDGGKVVEYQVSVRLGFKLE